MEESTTYFQRLETYVSNGLDLLPNMYFLLSGTYSHIPMILRTSPFAPSSDTQRGEAYFCDHQEVLRAEPLANRAQ